MNEYFYLDTEKKTHGPHTLDELRALHALGKLPEHTLAAPRGGNAWVPLSSLLNAPPPTLPPAVATVACPCCTTELSCSDNQLPELCPNCRYRLRAKNPHDLWQNFMLALRKTFVLKGRATRTEFWSFILFSAVLSTVAQSAVQACGFACVSGMDLSAPTFAESLSTPILVFLVALVLVFFILNILLTITQTTVTVRRLHDVGRSGKWLLAHILLLLVALGGLIGFAVVGAKNGKEILEAEYALVEGEWQHTSGEYETAPSWKKQGMRQALPVLMWGSLLPFCLSSGIALYILILSFKDSQPGSNRYGPSTKYPTA